jgi:glucose/arabinose dehydrogenase
VAQNRPPLYRTEELARGLKAPWAIAFLPDDAGLLITEKHGSVRRWRAGVLDPRPVTGGPINILQLRDAGLLDLALDPAFAENRLVYITFVEGTDSVNHTALFRARWDGTSLVDGRVIFRVTPDKAGPSHPGSRLAFLPDQTLLMTVGEGYDYRTQAQSLSTDLGKIVRLNRDGTVPASNPFRSDPSAKPEIYSYGHRNPQGLLVDPRDSTVWEHEHGPKSGDEINRILPGRNYGWPTATYGIDYDNTVIHS